MEPITNEPPPEGDRTAKLFNAVFAPTLPVVRVIGRLLDIVKSPGPLISPEIDKVAAPVTNETFAPLDMVIAPV